MLRISRIATSWRTDKTMLRFARVASAIFVVVIFSLAGCSKPEPPADANAIPEKPRIKKPSESAMKPTGTPAASPVATLAATEAPAATMAAAPVTTPTASATPVTIPAASQQAGTPTNRAERFKPFEAVPDLNSSPDQIYRYKDLHAQAAAGYERNSPLRGRDDGVPFEHLTAEPGIVVGFDLQVRGSGANAMIVDVRPVYRTLTKKIVPEAPATQADVVRVLDGKGADVVGLNVRGTTSIEAIQVIFGGPWPEDRIESPWYGNVSAAPLPTLLVHGLGVVGVYGKSAADGALNSIGLVYLPVPGPKIPFADPEDWAPVFDRIEAAVAAKKTVDSPMQGSGEVPFREVPGGGALLIGFETTTDIRGQGVVAIQPYYRNRNGTIKGSVITLDASYRGPTNKRRNFADRGYAVSGIKVGERPGQSVGFLTLHITESGLKKEMPVLIAKSSKPDPEVPGAVAAADDSPPPDHTKEFLVHDGSFIVGIYGKHSNGDPRKPIGIGLVTIPASALK
jgi:hypothetical protein